MRLLVVLAALSLAGCAVAWVPVKVAGTAVGVSAKAVGTTVLIVTRDAHPWD